MSVVDGEMFSVGVGEYSDVALPGGGGGGNTERG